MVRHLGKFALLLAGLLWCAQAQAQCGCDTGCGGGCGSVVSDGGYVVDGGSYGGGVIVEGGSYGGGVVVDGGSSAVVDGGMVM